MLAEASFLDFLLISFLDFFLIFFGYLPEFTSVTQSIVVPLYGWKVQQVGGGYGKTRLSVPSCYSPPEHQRARAPEPEHQRAREPVQFAPRGRDPVSPGEDEGGQASRTLSTCPIALLVY